mmetsp:Transcript_61215/g.182390  ORF Transcript_61215/g.182390 Transcript_61215/m.182390 type:complete len:267 (-) Transcript_61215:205-1005(-)
MTMTMVMPKCVIFFNISQSSSELVASSPEVGSSRKSSVGHAASSRPMFTRLRWPPLRPDPVMRLPTRRFCCASSCRTCSTSSVILLSRRTLVPAALRSSAEKRMFSRTVMNSCTTSSCGTKPMTGFRSAMLVSLPLTRTVPETSHKPPVLNLPQSALRKVVLPAPEGPMMADMRPAWNSPETPARSVLGGGLAHHLQRSGRRPTAVDRSLNSTETVWTLRLMPRKWKSCTDSRLKCFRMPTSTRSAFLTRCSLSPLRKFLLAAYRE